LINGGAIALVETAALTVTNSNLSDNHNDAFGGALLLYGPSVVNISRSTLARNVASAAGAVLNSGGIVTLSAATVADNTTFGTSQAVGTGNAIVQAYNEAGSMTILDSTITGNANTSSPGRFEAIGNYVASLSPVSYNSLTLKNTTVAGNAGSGVYNSGSLSILSSTIANNGEYGVGGTNAQPVVLANSILAGNSRNSPGAYPDFYFPNGSDGLTLQGANLVQSGLVWPSVINADPLLGPLQDNGGPTRTMALLPGSPAINLAQPVSGAVTTDQRGIARPQGSAPDLGAYERQATNATLTSMSYEYETRQAITFNFNADASVTFSRTSLTLKNLTTGQTIGRSVGTFRFNSTGTQATLVLTNLVPNGDYRVTSGTATPLDCFVLAGDANHDRVVNFDDYVRIDLGFDNHRTGYSNGDFNYDGVINFDDYVIIDTAFNSVATLGRAARTRRGELAAR
jgi:hypothetical protein